ncbi:MAG: HEAT repeat domain-containing protein [Planctomycetota bacterium]|nr:HEAT repeat domain-containing protein [Planctomycetota bacterium]
MTKTLALLAAFVPLALAAQGPTLLAPTDALSPEEQREKFHVPSGFEIQLVAAEPDIGQPMNLQFDAAGRLWATSSVEYPYPAQGPGVEERDEHFAGSDEPHAPRDWVVVISGIGADGKPQSITRFTEGLNIPIGHLPLKDGALVYGIPSLDRYTDGDGDGKADDQIPLLTGFGNIDTHGMVNGLRCWIDGWVYACHGFRNTSHVKGVDGRTLDMNSGNTFRFRPNGTGLEQLTWGQVNPFGQTFDALGNRYNADCHSMPLTCLLTGAYYSSFGKPHDGLGFGPNMIDHSHGSTGICGPAYYAADQFPADYRENMYLCNPVTGRVHRDKLVWHGSSPHVDTQPDFITCDDGWFRPVDLTVGPDGALYLADFYNAIIGHYEMPLGHPKRDRSKGRIWRIVSVGEDEATRAEVTTPPDLTTQSAEELLALLGDANLTIRTLASHELVDRHADEAVPLIKATFGGAGQTVVDAAAQRAHAMWVLERLASLESSLLSRLSKDESRLVRTHVAKLSDQREAWSDEDREVVLRLLGDDDAFVRRAAVEALGRHGDLKSVGTLIDLLEKTPTDDTHLVHTLRIAIRNRMSDARDLATLPIEQNSPFELRTIAGVAPAVKTTAASTLLIHILRLDLDGQADPVSDAEWPTAFAHVCRYGEPQDISQLISVVQSHKADDAEGQLALITAARTALLQRGDDSQGLLTEWGESLATSLLESSTQSLAWTQAPPTDGRSTWTVQQRNLSDGRKVACWTSLPSGEQRTGTLRSQPFEAPPAFSFFLAGHAGFPGKDAHTLNTVRLRDAATGAVLRETLPPRNDVAQKVEWNLADLAGNDCFIELVDGDTGTAYAWLAAGAFSVDGLNPNGASNPQQAAQLITDLRLEALTPKLKNLLADSHASDGLKSAAATALVGFDREPVLVSLVPLIGDPAVPESLRQQIAAVTLDRQPEAIVDVLAAAVKTLPSSAQLPIAERLVEAPAGAAALLALVEQGHASARLLTRPTVKARLGAHSDLADRVASATADLPEEDAALKTLIESRTNTFDASAADAERGVAVFTKNCANCHRIGSEGSLVGPQLDGIGDRGLARTMEDVLDPNRNVDGAFKASTIVLADGRVVTGLVRREEGESLVIADNAGKEFTVPKADVEERVTSSLSLMPANFGEAIPPDQFADLMAYLLRQRQTKQ